QRHRTGSAGRAPHSGRQSRHQWDCHMDARRHPVRWLRHQRTRPGARRGGLRGVPPVEGPDLPGLERLRGKRTMPGVLSGTKVLDLSWGIAGPMTAMLLADHGAAVTKIEPPDGDPFVALSGYRVWQRGKRNARLDLR